MNYIDNYTLAVFQKCSPFHSYYLSISAQKQHNMIILSSSSCILYTQWLVLTIVKYLIVHNECSKKTEYIWSNMLLFKKFMFEYDQTDFTLDFPQN